MEFLLQEMHAVADVTLPGIAVETPRRRQAGVALVIVLWMMTLLTVISASLVFATRTEMQIAGNLASLARAEALADAGVARALIELSRPRTPSPLQWQGDGRQHTWMYGEGELAITILDESGKVDINSAAAPLLVGLFRSAGAVDPEALADAVSDWRDADEFRSLKGAEKEDYLAAGLGYVPANSAFETIEELRQVLGMTEETYRRLERNITVHSYQGGVNSTIASRGVLMALPGVTADQVDPYVAQRRSFQEQGIPVAPFPAAQAFSAGPTGSAYSIQVDVVLRDNTRFSREAVVRVAAGAEQPVTILAWRSPAMSSRPTPAGIPITNSNGSPR